MKPSKDLDALILGDNADASDDGMPTLVSTELASVRHERRKGRSGQNPADRDMATI